MAVTDSRTRQHAPLLTARQVRDLLAIALILVGAVGLCIVVFLTNTLAGWGLVSAIVIALGVYVGVDRR